MPTELLVHPRVIQQSIGEEVGQRVLAASLAKLSTFRERPVHSVVAALDWDHRLPSKALTMRLHVCYEAATRARFEHALSRRRAEIAEHDRYPEFDVPDFGGLPADETYDVEL